MPIQRRPRQELADAIDAFEHARALADTILALASFDVVFNSTNAVSGNEVGKHHLLHARFTKRRKHLLDIPQEHPVRPDN